MALTQVKSDGIATGAVTATQIAANAVTVDDIADGSISTAKLADDAVTADKLANTAVTAGTYGSSSAIPSITVDAQGRITSASTSSIDSTAITNGTSNVSVAASGDITATRAGTQRLAVTSTGIDVTGTVDASFLTADGLTVDTNVLHVDSTNDRVGIGLTSPANTLHVRGPVSGTILNLDRGGSYSWKFGQSTGSHLTITGDTTERFRFGPDGQLGIGGANYGSSGQVLTSQGSSAAPQWATPAGATWSTSSAVALSGTSTTISGIDTNADQILVTIENASLNANADLIFRVGTSGGIVTSSYHVAAGYYSTGVSSTNRTTGFYTFSTGTASVFWNGFWILYRIAGNRYYGMLHIVNEGGSTVHYAEGNIDCSARIDRIQALGASGSWDSGNMVVRYMVP